MPLPVALAVPGGGRVLSIQSHTVHGYVGNKAAVFPLQLLGFDVDPINSVQFSNHTGYPSWKGQVLNGEQLTSLIDGLEANNLLHYSHMLTGYIGSLSFLEVILSVLQRLRAVNPDLVYVCDPVLGDQGNFYTTPDLVPVYREKVVPVASILTPNQFEAEQLTQLRISTEQEAFAACDALHDAGPPKVIITSMEAPGGGMLWVLGSQRRKETPTQPAGTVRFRIDVPHIPTYFTGTGDLLAALILGWDHRHPEDLVKATELSISSLQGVLQKTLDDHQSAGVLPPEKQMELRLVQSRADIMEPQATFKATIVQR